MSSLPSYQQLFGDLDFRQGDDARSVCSPAAYLADLLRLGGEGIGRRRADLRGVPLDAEHTTAEVPYLDIVNEVLAADLAARGKNLAEMVHPLSLPFSLEHARDGIALRRLGTGRAEVYQAFADQPDADVLARAALGLTEKQAALITTELADGARLRECLGVESADGDPYAELEERAALGVTQAETETLLSVIGGTPRTAAWFERAHRFVRLARGTGLTFAELDLVLRSCCGNRIDAAAIRIIAELLDLRRELDRPLETVVSLVESTEAPVGSAVAPVGSAVALVEGALTDAEKAAAAERYDGTLTPAQLSRVGVLTDALGVSVDELFDLIEAGGGDDPYTSPEKVLSLVRLARWLGETGLTTDDLLMVLGAGRHSGDVEPFEAPGEAWPEAEIFVSERFGPRAAQVIHDVLPEFSPYEVLGELPVVAADDLLGIGLDERLATKIYTNLVLRGYLDADGIPLTEEEPVLAGDFTAWTHSLAWLLADLWEQDDLPTCFLSDLRALDGLDDAGRAELYDNLIFNGYVDTDGRILRAELEQTNADLSGLAEHVHDILRERSEAFAQAVIPLDPVEFASLIGDAEDWDTLLRSLQFNGHLDDDYAYRDPAGLLELTPAEFTVDVRFHPMRRELLDAVQGQVIRARAEMSALTVDDFRDLADAEAARRALDGGEFTDGENAQIALRLATIAADGAPYRADPDVVPAQLLIDAGYLTEQLMVPQELLEWFGRAHHVNDFVVPELGDFSREVFLLLHAAAVQTVAAVDEITATLAAWEATQRDTLFSALQDAYGISAASAEAIWAGVAGDPADPVTMRRFRGFAVLAARLGLQPADIAVAFHDQDLRESYAEPLALPPGADGIDAILERDGEPTLLFRGDRYWTLPSAVSRPLSDLVGALVSVDAAFTDPGGTSWIAGRDRDGVSSTFTRGPGHTRWARRTQEWGKVRNVFAEAARIDAAFVDEAGRAYLFCGEHYVRYSGPDYTQVDPGYPRLIGQWWEGDVHGVPLPPRFQGALDAAFRGHDGVTYLFAGETFVAVGGARTPVERPIAGVWGRVPQPERFDAAYVKGSSLYLLAGDQVIRQSNCVENDDLGADDGYPRRIGTELPGGFDSGVEAAFADTAGVVHLFKQGRTIALEPDGPSAAPTAERWGKLIPILPGGKVDAALTGLDGRTYLFSGDHYVRYSAADYTAVDSGYPRAVTDWGGLRRVTAAFTMDGATHLFGEGGLLFRTPKDPDVEAELEAGRLPGRLLGLLEEHGLGGTTVSAPWQLTTTGGVRLTVTRTEKHLEVSCDPGADGFHVRYSRREYGEPDPGYPRPLDESWWNPPLPSRGAAVFTTGDGRVHLVTGGTVSTFDGRRRWWTPPRPLAEQWDDLPFETLSAACTGIDGRTYFFAGSDYARYSSDRLDDRYPAPTTGFWGTVVNHLARTGQVDATLVVGEHTYLFSGDQFVRYTGDARVVDLGYPRRLDGLPEEPRLTGLLEAPETIDAAFADRGNVYLISGDDCHVVSTARHRRYDNVMAETPACAVIDDGALFSLGYYGWRRYTSIEGGLVESVTREPRQLWGMPGEYRVEIDAVLHGTDGTTYIFKGPNCWNSAAEAAYPLAEEWGRPRNNLWHESAVDAGFVAADGRTYVFSGDQFVVYDGLDYAGAYVKGPFLISDHFAGLTEVALAYVYDGVTYLFEPSGRYVVYSGKELDEPDEGFPQMAGADFWGIPPDYLPDGFTMPDAVLANGEHLLALIGDTCLTFEEASGTWAAPRPLARIWRGIGATGDLRTAFTGRDGATYFFFGTDFTRFSGGVFAERRPVRDHWGLTGNDFTRIDAAFAHDGITYLFAGGQYCRYSTSDYRWTDPGYPRSIADHLREEPPFAALPMDALDELAGHIDAVVSNDRNVYLFAADACHVLSQDQTTTFDVRRLGRARNTVAERGRVDAALVTAEHTYLFSGDQAIRYTGDDYSHVDEGFPLTLAAALPGLPPGFRHQIDAAFQAPGGGDTYLFAGGQYARDNTVAPLAGAWGVPRDDFRETGLQAAFVAPTGDLYAFSGTQYVRYPLGELDVVEDGYPRPIAGDWEFSDRVDGAFTLRGRTYLVHGDRYARYSDGYAAMDRTFPQRVADRFADTADYRLSDLRLIASYRALGLGPAFTPDAPPLEDPYAYVAEALGWDAGELRWCRRVSRFADDTDRLELEFLAHAAGIFALARRTGVAPSKLHDGAYLTEELTERLHDELNVALRDALVAASGSPDELFARFLIDVQAGGGQVTSRVREGIGAVQLYLHRYLLNLEDPSSDEETRERIRQWWSWMRAYRLWEANRAVFLYPENYLRPELRTARTPAFKALESDLLQGEITAETVDRAYRRYLDEYTEVSRLTIAGGYVYTKDQLVDGPRRLILFGRTKTDPRRYYHRRAEFGSRMNLAATWEPWQPVGVRIDADRVHPVHAFGRVFVFWTITETVVDAKATQRVRIRYSFQDLTGGWVPEQTLGDSPLHEGTISGVRLLVLPRMKADTGRMSVLASCTYTVAETPVRLLYDLNPELYADQLPADAEDDLDAVTADRVAQIFLDPVDPAAVVRLDAPAGTDVWPWFSVDHKGGSFLCRPVTVTPEDSPELRLVDNEDGLPAPGPEWTAVDAAVALPGGSRMFFDNSGHRWRLGSETAPIAPRWGLARQVLTAPGVVDTVLVRGERTFVFSGTQYVAFTGTPFERPDPGYPRDIDGNPDQIPYLGRIDVAFATPDGVEYFVSGDRWVTSEAPATLRPLTELWTHDAEPFTLRTALVTDDATFFIGSGRSLRFPHPDQRERGAPFGAPRGDGIVINRRFDVVARRGQTRYYFDNDGNEYVQSFPRGRDVTRPIHVPSAILTSQAVDAAWVGGGKLYLSRGDEYVRYTLDGDTVPALIDDGYPAKLPRVIDTVFPRGTDLYLFSGADYCRISAATEPNRLPAFTAVAGAWAELPAFTAALPGIFFLGPDSYVKHDTTLDVPRPYELSRLPFEIVRLTTGTASELNRKLLSGGVDALLDLSTQETDEVPLSVDAADVTAIRVSGELVDDDRLPSGSHLDFRSANGLYYWEIFFHAPVLIAQALNQAQRFEDARRWYEYVFDPTDPRSCWRFLPFLSVDPGELADGLAELLTRVRKAGSSTTKTQTALDPVLTALRDLAPAVAQSRDPRTPAEQAALVTITDPSKHKDIADAVRAMLAVKTITPARREAIERFREATLLAVEAGTLFDAVGDRESLMRAYQDDPFDPHAVAGLRPVAYRRAVVMAYIDNLLDWGDMLFRQFTPETVDEARMLYVLAHDLLGERPERLATRLLPARTAAELTEQDVLGFLTGGGTLLAGAGEVHAGLADPYFTIGENRMFAAYWDRVDDRLAKIRASQDILGVARSLPLFAPPVDAAALVAGVADGAAPAEIAAASASSVPHLRFGAVHRQARELADRLTQFGGELLSVLERGSAEELSLLQSRQEQAIRAMGRDIRLAHIRAAEQNLAQLTVNRTAAAERITHYETLLATGLTVLETAELEAMRHAGNLHLSAGVLKGASALAHIVPQFSLGPFILGSETGGEQAGESLDKFAETSESLGEAFSMMGEALGRQAQHERLTQDWTLQAATARSEVLQLDHQIAGASEEVTIARREAEIAEREIAGLDEVATFLRAKFASSELYTWMAGRMSSLYFQAYQLAYDTATAAERAYQFEHGSQERFIAPAYWESRRNGLLAGAALSVDLDRLGRAHLDDGGRGLEITRQVWLSELDPVALLSLRSSASGEFALTENLFDRDFPGHYRRQLRTIAVTFMDAEGQVLALNATLTQLSHQTVLSTDPSAVRHLLDPQGVAPSTVRGDWRGGQEIVLSEVDQGQSNNGMFELRYDDERYLPFEGTGAVSAWRLSLSAAAVSPYDVLLTVRYTAEPGGASFAEAVKAMLKPHQAARLFDVARDFPAEWASFVGGGALELPFTTNMFPDMAGRRITGVLTAYDLTDGVPARLQLDGEPLPPGTLVAPSGLSIRDGAVWSFTLDGDRAALNNVGLVLTYQAH
ncbi:hemopexin repeat-containing protein [Paractinoplanes atraurantiacus]|uniref:Hemopexin n=1 Tax=Paractinoplanes atraurantiacus TaxID=1036182 RepID=A0A285HRU9_9ACTN|nr:hemopexin repeat-containing protein [Actinoplanes atraurantiacus]SNY38429.1 Hemopexin [Actinoplanes atraurantiacus]